MNNDNDAIEKIKANQNRIQRINFTNEENAFFNNPDMVGKYEEVEEGASGDAAGAGSTNKAGMNALGFFKAIKKWKFVIIGILIACLFFGVVLIGTLFTNEQWKGFFVTDNVNGNTSNSGSTSTSGGGTTSGAKDKVQAVVSSYYKSARTSNESFFYDLKQIVNNYNNYSLENGLSLIDGEFDIALIASTIHFNKFISDETIISGVMNGSRTKSNMGIARSRGYTTIPKNEIKSFYELASLSLGTDLGIPDEEFRGLSGHLVGSKVVSMCVADNSDFLPSTQISGLVKGEKVTYSLLDSIIIRYENLYYTGNKIYDYDNNNEKIIDWYSRQLKISLDNMRSNGTFNDYYDTSLYNPNMNCGSNYLVHYVQKYMNYQTYAKYLLNEYVPENYIECVDCGSANKRTDTISIAYEIFNNRNLFASYYYDDVIDTMHFSNGDAFTTTESQYQLPDEIIENFTSPYGLSTTCTISSDFTSNRNGYSHYAIDAYSNTVDGRPLYAVYDGVVKVVVDGIPNIFNQWNGGACVNSSGVMDSRSSGNYVVIEHNFGGKTYRSYYMHLNSIDVKPGDVVTKGQKIGTEGNSGCSSGNHLHFQLFSTDGKRYNPSLLFSQCKGVNIISYEATTLKEYLESIYPNYSFTNQKEYIVKVYDKKNSGTYSSIDLESYVAGVVNNEMSESYNIEALKAQAILARTEYIDRVNFFKKDEIVPNDTTFQTYSKVDTENSKTDVINVLAARETVGKIVTYAHSLYHTEYANFPCEKVYACNNPTIYYYYDDGRAVAVDRYIPWYDVKTGEVTCKAEKGYASNDKSRVTITSNTLSSDGGGDTCPASGEKGSFYYCGSTKYPRQFRKQANLASIVGDCSEISVDLRPNSNYGGSYRTIPVSATSLGIGHTDNPEDDYSDFRGHNNGMSQVLANIYANNLGWNYEKIIDYFYANKIFDSKLINIDTPLVLLDDLTEYEANYSDCCRGKITIKAGSINMTVPVDFYVAGVLARNFDSSVNQNLLKALAISSRTWAYNNSLWGRNVLETKDQYSYTYTDNKIIYDAVNATKDDVLVDYDGYITPTEYYYVGDNGTIKGSGNQKTITYELGYLYIDSTHKVMIPYDEQFNNTNIKGNVGIVFNVASYLANNWYFVDHYEILKFFYGEDFKVLNIDNMATRGLIKDKDGNIKGTLDTSDAYSSALNYDLEEYVSEAGKGTLNGVLAAAYWLYVHSNNGGEISLPYQLAGEYPYIGVNPNWGMEEANPIYPQYSRTGLDCVGFIRWAFVNGYFDMPKDFGRDTFRYQAMVKWIEKHNLACGENGESCYVEFEDNAGHKNVRSLPLGKYADAGLIKPGDVLYHYSNTVYYGESAENATKYSHIAIVYDVDLQNRTLSVIHSSGGDPGVHYSTMNLDTGLYESGAKHGFTSVIRMSEMEERGYFN